MYIGGFLIRHAIYGAIRSNQDSPRGFWGMFHIGPVRLIFIGLFMFLICLGYYKLSDSIGYSFTAVVLIDMCVITWLVMLGVVIVRISKYVHSVSRRVRNSKQPIRNQEAYWKAQRKANRP